MPLSVVLLWRDPEERIEASLVSILGQVQAVGGEVLVVSGGSEPAGVPSGARWLRVAPPFTEPAAWAAGTRAARGGTIAFGHARNRFAPGWARAVLVARDEGAGVVSGPVVLDPSAPLARRVDELCDYASFDDPHGISGGGASSCNVAWDRRALDDRLARGEPLSKWAILASGSHQVAWRPDMRVDLGPGRRFGAAGVARFRRGRHYAALRSAAWPRAGRWAAGLACVALPVVLYARLMANGAVRRKHGRALVLGLPWFGLALGLWSLGELAGYWAGSERGGDGP